jgi:hypothetical protein
MTALVAARGPVRLRPAPAYEPPYDDELPADAWGAGPLQPLLDLPPPFAPAPVTDRPASYPPASTGVTPATAAAARQFTQACLEILNGYRPVAHFRALAHPLEAAAVLAAMTLAYRRLRQATGRDMLLRRRTMRTCEPRPGVAEIALVIGVDPPPRGRAPARAPAGRPTPANRLRPANRLAPAVPVRSVRGRDRAASPVVWALAYRLEQRHGRWLCTAAQLL